MEQLDSNLERQSSPSTPVDDQCTTVQRGEFREGVILSLGEEKAIVDLGEAPQGLIPPEDMRRLDDEVRTDLSVGDTVPVVVTDPGENGDEVIVSLKQGLARQDWQRAREMQETGELYEARVSEVNRGGLMIPFGQLWGFVPNSELSSVPRGVRGKRLRRLKEDLVGRRLTTAVIEVEQRKRRLVLSERAANRQQRDQLLAELEEGQTRRGIVCSLTNFGAFVDLGGVDGLIHISELDHQHVTHPSDVVQVGDEVGVYVLNVDRERERVGLSRKRLLSDPWQQVTERLRPGQVVEGTVTGIAKFGAFVELGEGVEGLVHVSEMPGGEDLLEDLTEGSSITVRVLKIDDDRRRIALSLRLTMYEVP
jgi:small subunit ribosomal protein S1